MDPPGIFLNRAAYFFSNEESDGQGNTVTRVGTWITQDQCNSENFAHGGFTLTFADFALTYILMGITINLSADFLRPVPLGAWLEAKIRARRRSKKLIFADAIACADGVEALRISGIFQPFVGRDAQEAS